MLVVFAAFSTNNGIKYFEEIYEQLSCLENILRVVFQRFDE